MENKKDISKIVLAHRKKGSDFANGFQIYKQTDIRGDEKVFKFGDIYVLLESEFDLIFSLGDLKLDWVDFKQPYVPTFWEKVRKKLFNKPYQEFVVNRPRNGSIVIVDYGNWYETVEFSYSKNHTPMWVTALYTGINPTRWSYIPNWIFESAAILKSKPNI
jgi:hypothetical protein